MPVLAVNRKDGKSIGRPEREGRNHTARTDDAA
jgi:hypothetical protein